MSPYHATIGERWFDNAFIEPPDSEGVGPPKLAHGVSMEEQTFFSFSNFVFNVRGPFEFIIQENSKVFDSKRVFDRGIIESEKREGVFRGFVFSVKEDS